MQTGDRISQKSMTRIAIALHTSSIGIGFHPCTPISAIAVRISQNQ
ncbi:MAG: hypothetical protein ACK6CP_05380 [Pseudanabaena sp.]|nr:hypothetical protein [Pseudanabaena sp. M110S1SP2A07QC]MCA6523454.1 hypothetical protein [Pseudanabaena sp. M051S1SP2A07QC]MCA6530549.1 hypothetical protein [Pseudanabaena sp. M125S2SP2A07QC]MCA6537721.1 hypothetical protein [Pseudanabaena sp. M037S2SP2A07QC]MCA6541935.1 hypothetical protein [Pseudanabaena sp. M074S1SP2A07QC]MCA6548751.1 hypothetical protein [Pseudanabaena sp. M152S2SP2A07QC]MCA6552768.1 hypothetical protein [Pseudanabaena sp. M135S2SP2A07QC]MCA6569312.1 hypothetical prot